MRPAAALLWSFAIHVTLGGVACFAADPRAAQLTYGPWIKHCLTGTCFVGSGARGACHPSGGDLSVITRNNRRPCISAYFATKQPIEGAISLRIDQRDPIVIAVSKCIATSCAAELEIDDEFVERLKRSRTIEMEAMDADHRKVSLSLSLAGFAEAYDGPGTETKILENIVSDEKWQELLKEAEEQRERAKAFECRE
jgi:hypothetical protein